MMMMMTMTAIGDELARQKHYHSNRNEIENVEYVMHSLGVKKYLCTLVQSLARSIFTKLQIFMVDSFHIDSMRRMELLFLKSKRKTETFKKVKKGILQICGKSLECLKWRQKTQ